MTDKEIIKCAENCTSDSPSCGICLYNDDRLTSSECMGELMKDLFDLINRQQAEIAELQRKNTELEIELKAMRGAANSYKAEVERLKKIVEDYAKAARVIELYLHKFCNKKLPYDEMIADASRKAEEEIERLQKAIKVQDIMIEQQDYKLKTAKSEAIKKFAERLKATDTADLVGEQYINGEIYSYFYSDAFERKIDNLVKEMTEVSDG